MLLPLRPLSIAKPALIKGFSIFILRLKIRREMDR